MNGIGLFTPDDLKNIPTFRAAYSDRTAFLMAKLAYRGYELFDSDDASWAKFNDAIVGTDFTVVRVSSIATWAPKAS